MGNVNVEEFGPSRPTVFISDDHLARAFNWPDSVAALAAAYAQPMDAAMVPPRGMARGKDVWLRSLTAVSPSGRHMGCKLIAAKLRGRPVLASYLLALIRQDNLQAAAIMDANRITGIRTAATAVVALNALHASGDIRLAILGSGFESTNFVEALTALRQVVSARVFSPTEAKRNAFAERFRHEKNLAIEAVATAEEAVRGANVVLCAARSRDETPILSGAWLLDGATVISLGSTLAEQREVDSLTLRRARVIVADMVEEVIHDTGDGIAATADGVDLGAKTVSLQDVVAGRCRLREESGDIIVYKSVGTALQDVVIAEMLYDRALECGLFDEMKSSIQPIGK